MRMRPCKNAMASSSTASAERTMASRCSAFNSPPFLEWGNEVYDDGHDTEGCGKGQRQHIVALELHGTSLTTSPAATASTVATCLHGDGECFGSPETAEEKRDQ